ncbi:type II toxin-antitoxin system VapC family toxin [Nodularia spumigena CS-584]|uniref:tRNA(fMet)-specific endonuclease VapC n=2 Tax=Nodularia spumigena TaxID=70799 RepID=A0A2S0Q8T8_NODSP|nr:type II toxin-antitoxin system VapC family toxin [Nodularia spumigena]AVZ30869.1 tRNA(fMet)-specific endonuclease VapC [Nodularia spumigena UHCC 0039]EAW45526.1 hypothetical protein N9414_05424 [Nodularia spumigena CCY9414]MDB9383303.1 type II toxin-antitoxin system VapC family toxin [Nodularia spumigena CS-584]MEA5525063.1 type II toxin-antitoxin system VapC family toxin [Nodularia spumigena UHCC 0143]MEA5607824.1 type II toxin-antitoxin system VapC family toxin [Nodularia spumigena UHCC 0
MANLYILDTDHLSLFQNKDPIVTQRISQENPENIALTVITLQEQMKGWLKEINKYNSQPFNSNNKLVWAYKGLADEIEFFKSIRLLTFDDRAYKIYQLLVIQKLKRIGTMDLRIASIAKSVNGIVVTRNRQDFQNVPNLVLEDWTIS